MFKILCSKPLNWYISHPNESFCDEKLMAPDYIIRKVSVAVCPSSSTITTIVLIYLVSANKFALETAKSVYYIF